MDAALTKLAVVRAAWTPLPLLPHPHLCSLRRVCGVQVGCPGIVCRHVLHYVSAIWGSCIQGRQSCFAKNGCPSSCEGSQGML